MFLLPFGERIFECMKNIVFFLEIFKSILWNTGTEPGWNSYLENLATWCLERTECASSVLVAAAALGVISLPTFMWLFLLSWDWECLGSVVFVVNYNIVCKFRSKAVLKEFVTEVLSLGTTRSCVGIWHLMLEEALIFNYLGCFYNVFVVLKWKFFEMGISQISIFSIYFYFNTALLRYNLHNITFTYFKCTI